jgi:hypothetical protein
VARDGRRLLVLDGTAKHRFQPGGHFRFRGFTHPWGEM